MEMKIYVLSVTNVLSVTMTILRMVHFVQDALFKIVKNVHSTIVKLVLNQMIHNRRRNDNMKVRTNKTSNFKIWKYHL